MINLLTETYRFSKSVKQAKRFDNVEYFCKTFLSSVISLFNCMVFERSCELVQNFVQKIV